MSEEFNFHVYLISKLSIPDHQIVVDVLTGGFTNTTVRATFSPPIEIHNRTLSSAILKYAPPFLSSDPSHALSIRRQANEGRALRLLHQHPIDSKDGLPRVVDLVERYPTISIPDLIEHDTEHNVLWMTDLGRVDSLSTFFRRTAIPTVDALKSIAGTLGVFLREFFLETQVRNGVLPTPLVESLATQGVSDDIVEIVTGITKDYLRSSEIDGQKLSETDISALCELVKESLQEAGQADEERCLGMVDLWPGSILLYDGQGQGQGTSGQSR